MAYRKRIDKEFANIIKEITSNEKVNEMKKYKQHYDVSTYEHCIHVSYMCYVICKKLKLDYISAARAGMLHDLFLYDWHGKQYKYKLDYIENTKKPEFLKRYLRLHAFSHPKIALKNAKDEFELNELEQEMILKHMWPVTIALPRHIETYIITIADKLCAINESVEFYKRQEKIRMAYMYAFLFSCVLNTVTCIVI